MPRTSDPNFAMAWEWSGIMYRNAGETDLALDNLSKAYALAGRVTERENASPSRDAITAS